MDELKKQLEAAIKALEASEAKIAEQQKTLGRVLDETVTQHKALQTQVDAIDAKLVQRHTATTDESKSIIDVLQENEDVARLIRDKKGRAIINFTGKHAQQLWERKSISGLTAITPNVVDGDRAAGIVTEARRALTVRSVLSSRPTALPLVYWVKVNSPLSLGSPQVEAASKFENAVTFTTASSQVKTLATFIRASKQALMDFSELGGFLESSLPYYVDREEERQLLSGDNTGENLNGLITQATAFNTALLSAAAGWTRIDQIGAAIEQIGIADEIDPGFVIVNKRDWWNIRRTKDSYGRYILGDPQTVGNPKLWDLTPIPTNSIAAGTFLVGSSESAASEIRDNMEMQVDISTEDADNFTKNMVTIRAEKRLCLAVMRPGSYISGTFTTSPANL